MNQYDLIIIGGGISGMTAALTALENGIKKILLLEREEILGGILNQCIHNGFGKKVLNAEFTGPEYINVIEEKLKEYKIDIKVNTEVLDISMDKIVSYVNPDEGVVDVKASAIILATGCREKYTGSIVIPTNRFTGIYTIGNAHRIINIEGYLPGKEPVIIASSRWALIVARRLFIEGANIKALVVKEGIDFTFNEENQNIIKGFDIPIIKDSKIVEVFGTERIEGVKILNKEKDQYTTIACDSLLLSVGYFPEVDLARKIKISINPKNLGPEVNEYETSFKGVFACGNLIYGINALNEKDIDGIEAGKKASEYITKFIY
ncbi:NAD(P)/FAD-dependent oxidoreductase [Clostridium paraputrificum]|uniref:NAD(P)/FAD-dependent oxidoreductase n=1 Tax=Clostridium paraputrificum TaxID=29363 RepID=UPI003D34597C